jgi:hypothetical protein
MPNVTNQAYLGTTGTLVIDGDTHFGVTSFKLVPTNVEEQVEDISGDVQSFAGTTKWRAQSEFHQDHITDGSLSRKSMELAGTVVPFEYTPQDGGEGRSGNMRWLHTDFGGGTDRHAVQADFPVIGQPAVVPIPTP